jgi:hypothetical protein
MAGLPPDFRRRPDPGVDPRLNGYGRGRDDDQRNGLPTDRYASPSAGPPSNSGARDRRAGGYGGFQPPPNVGGAVTRAPDPRLAAQQDFRSLRSSQSRDASLSSQASSLSPDGLDPSGGNWRRRGDRSDREYSDSSRSRTRDAPTSAARSRNRDNGVQNMEG